MTETEMRYDEIRKDILKSKIQTLVKTGKNTNTINLIKNKISDLDKINTRGYSEIQEAIESGKNQLQQRINELREIHAREEREKKRQYFQHYELHHLTEPPAKTQLQIKLVNTLKETGPTQRSTLVEILSTPRTTIYDNLERLQKKDIVERFSRNNGKRGRPKVYWKLKEQEEVIQEDV